MQLERAGRIEPSKGGVEGLATVDDEALLMEIMEARELVDSTEVRPAPVPAGKTRCMTGSGCLHGCSTEKLQLRSCAAV